MKPRFLLAALVLALLMALPAFAKPAIGRFDDSAYILFRDIGPLVHFTIIYTNERR